MSCCKYCGSKMESGRYCTSCGKLIKMKKHNSIIYSIITFVLGNVCFIPNIYISQNYYKVGAALVSAEFGDDSELMMFRTLESVSEITLILGILLIVVAVVLFSFFIWERKKNKNISK